MTTATVPTSTVPAVRTNPTPAPVQQQRLGAMAIMAGRYNVEPAKLLATLKSTVFKGATDEELLALVVVSNEYGLNPLLKEIYAFPSKQGGIVPIVSVDGWNKMAIRAESFDGIEFEFTDSEDGKPYSCTSIIYVKGRSRPVKVTEYYSECYRKTDPWDKMPRRMLRHKALIQGSRVAFGFAGLYDEDEAIDINPQDRFSMARPVIATVDEPAAKQAKQPVAKEETQTQAETSPATTEPVKTEAKPATSISSEGKTVLAAPATPIDTEKDLEKLGAMMVQIKCSEGDLLAWMKESKYISAQYSSAQEFGEASPKRLNALVTGSEKYLPLIAEWLAKRSAK